MANILDNTTERINGGVGPVDPLCTVLVNAELARRGRGIHLYSIFGGADGVGRHRGEASRDVKGMLRRPLYLPA